MLYSIGAKRSSVCFGLNKRSVWGPFAAARPCPAQHFVSVLIPVAFSPVISAHCAEAPVAWNMIMIVHRMPENVHLILVVRGL